MAEARSARDPTILAIPFFFASMAAEYAISQRRSPSAGDYERSDTVASLTMGTLSLIAPVVGARVLRPITPGRGRYGKALVAAAAGTALLTTAADFIGRRGPAQGRTRTKIHAAAARVSAAGGVASVVMGGLAVATYWQSKTSVARMWRLRRERSPGKGPLPWILAIAGWDFIYYWNHRFMHESRYMWAIHVVHHSSERYNLSTALRQPVLEALGTPLPYGVLCLAGITPGQVEMARGVNLLYQYWIHTEVIERLGPAELALNTPSHHRVHHGSNRTYIDRNHGSILILWDRLFGTFQRENERVIYGLTKNIRSFNIATIATHELGAILRDVATSTSWRDRIGYVVRSPGWADRRRLISGTPQ